MTMKHILYLGLRPPKDTPQVCYTHLPVISTVPVNGEEDFIDLEPFTHIIFTSRTAVQLMLQKAALNKQTVIAVGQATYAELRHLGYEALVPVEETAEGVIGVLSQLDLSQANVLWPRSGQARSVISDYLRENKIQFTEYILYNVVPRVPEHIPDLALFDEILFTSPSTVEAFLKIYPELPANKCRAIGRITEEKVVRCSGLNESGLPGQH